MTDGREQQISHRATGDEPACVAPRYAEEDSVLPGYPGGLLAYCLNAPPVKGVARAVFLPYGGRWRVGGGADEA